MNYEQDIIVLNVKRFDFTGKDGKAVKGCNVHGVLSDILTPNKGADELGWEYCKYSMDYDAFDMFDVVPGVYKASLGLGGGGKYLKAKSFQFVKNLD